MKNRKSGKNAMAVVAKELANPPKRQLAVGGNMVFRFMVKLTQQDAAFSRNSITSLLLQNTAATANTKLIQSILLKRIEIWSPPTLGTTSSIVNQQASVVWYGTQTGFKVANDANVANTATYVSSSPPKASTASFWSETGIDGSEILFKLCAPIDSVIDLHCDITLASEAFLQNFYTTTLSGTAGQTYYNCLDGTAGNISPPSILTILY
jgi:hypothetical protein